MSGPSKFCPFSAFLFMTSAAAYTYHRRTASNMEAASSPGADGRYQVVFVLGGPGAGKGTQCELLSERLGWAHLSAGDLLRAERNSGSALAGTINANIAAGKIVPAEITVGLLEKAMEKLRAEGGCTRFLIDGFPRSEGNVTVWKEIMEDGDNTRADVRFVLFLDCPEDTMTSRLLERAKTSGRVDDTIDVIRKRFVTFRGESMPIVDAYEKEGKVRKVIADRHVEEVYKEVAKLVADS